MHRVEDLYFANGARTRVGEVAAISGRGQRAQAARVGRRVADRVEDLHVADIVNVERLFEAYHQPRAVELDGEDGVAVAVVAYFRALLVVAHYQLPGRSDGDHGDEAGAEQPVDETGVLARAGRIYFLDPIVGGQREQVVALAAAGHQ